MKLVEFVVDDPKLLQISLNEYHTRYGINVAITQTDTTDFNVPTPLRSMQVCEQTLTLEYADIMFRFKPSEVYYKSIETLVWMFVMLVSDQLKPDNIDVYMANITWIRQMYHMLMHGVIYQSWWLNGIAVKFMPSEYEELYQKSMLEIFHTVMIYGLMEHGEIPHMERFLDTFTTSFDQHFIRDIIDMIITDMTQRFQTKTKIEYKTFVDLDQPFTFRESDLHWLQSFCKYYKS